MQNDDLSADPRYQGAVRASRSAPDEKTDAAEALEGAAWESYETPASDRRPRGSGFLSGDDAGRVRTLIERQLRERPLPTLLLAVAAGWLAGKILR